MFCYSYHEVIEIKMYIYTNAKQNDRLLLEETCTVKYLATLLDG